MTIASNQIQTTAKHRRAGLECARCGTVDRDANGNCKPCGAERCRKYRAANRDVLNAKKKVYVEANREKVAERRRAWHEANREKVLADGRARHAAKDRAVEAAKRRAWYDANRESAASTYRERMTGWTKGEFEGAWLAQSGRCAICDIEMNKGGRGARSVTADHCHASKRRRALLCSNCNRAIGLLGDSPRNAQAAAAYLEAHR